MAHTDNKYVQHRHNNTRKYRRRGNTRVSRMLHFQMALAAVARPRHHHFATAMAWGIQAQLPPLEATAPSVSAHRPLTSHLIDRK